MPTDLLLSSGFLAFARHVGVLGAIEAKGIAVDAVVGTSSGALVGSLWAAGLPAAELERLVAGERPLGRMGFHLALWRGAFSLDPLIAWLAERLPPTFAELPRPFAVGVRAPDGRGLLLRQGPLPAAVAASCAIPGIFAPVRVEGVPYQDGGMVDRLMIRPWREWRGDRPAIAHIVDRSNGAVLTDALDGLTVIRTPRSGASFFSLGDVPAAAALARARADDALGDLASAC